MRTEVYDYNKLENYIRVGNSASNLANFPTPSSIGYLLADVDKDPFTDLKGYTHRNRVRHDVLSLEVNYAILSENDLSTILNKISPVWIYVEIKDKKTKKFELNDHEPITVLGRDVCAVHNDTDS